MSEESCFRPEKPSDFGLSCILSLLLPLLFLGLSLNPKGIWHLPFFPSGADAQAPFEVETQVTCICGVIKTGLWGVKTLEAPHSGPLSYTPHLRAGPRGLLLSFTVFLLLRQPLFLMAPHRRKTKVRTNQISYFCKWSIVTIQNWWVYIDRF